MGGSRSLTRPHACNPQGLRVLKGPPEPRRVALAQGQPVVVAARCLDDGDSLARRRTRRWFVRRAQKIRRCEQYYGDVEGGWGDGRDPDHLKIMTGLSVFVGPRTRDESAGKISGVAGFDPDAGRSGTASKINRWRLTGLDVDGPPCLSPQDRGPLSRVRHCFSDTARRKDDDPLALSRIAGGRGHYQGQSARPEDVDVVRIVGRRFKTAVCSRFNGLLQTLLPQHSMNSSNCCAGVATSRL